MGSDDSIYDLNSGVFVQPPSCPECHGTNDTHYHYCSKRSIHDYPYKPANNDITIRTFSSGAVRDSNTDKLDYYGFTSALVTKRFGEYMHKNRQMQDGSVRDSDNWKAGFDPKDTIRSLCRHVEDVKLHMEGYPTEAWEDLQTALCAVIFNAQSMLLDTLKGPK